MLTKKRKLRIFYKNRVKNLKPQSLKIKQSQLIKNLKTLDLWSCQNQVAGYKSLAYEANLDSFYKTSLKGRCFFPVISCQKLDFYKPYKREDFKPHSQFPVLEPQKGKREKINLNQISVFLIPGLAFDRQGARLGHGKGYYDRTLKNRQGLKVGIGFSDQIHQGELPVENQDVFMDIIVTENFILIPQMANFKKIIKRVA